MSRRHTLAVNERDKKWSTPRKKNGLTGRVGATELEYFGAKMGPIDTKKDKGMVQKVGGRGQKLDTGLERVVDGEALERTEAGGSGTGAKRDTSAAR